MRRIEELRGQIDVIDSELLRLLNRRAQIAIVIASVKRCARLPIYCPDRERDDLSRACRANAGPLENPAVKRLFRPIIREIRHARAASAKRGQAGEAMK
jgi:chorismate mutase